MPSSLWKRISIGCGLAALFSSHVTADPLTTTFTYQGKLNNGGQPANGLYDLTFTLYDALSNGAPVGASAVFPAVGVSNGIFTVGLSFGPSAFNGQRRWIEIAVRTNNTSFFQALSPRQELTAEPHAVYALSAGTAAVASRLAPTPYVDPVVLTSPANTFTGSFSGDGSGLSNHVYYIDVKRDFHAYGDGIHPEDTAAIQNALNAAATNLSPTEVRLRAGDYLLTNTISIPPNSRSAIGIPNWTVKMTGDGYASTRLIWKQSGNAPGLAFASPAGYANLQIDGVGLYGPLNTAWDQANTSIGLLGGHIANGWTAEQVSIRNCAVVGWAQGVVLSNLWNVQIFNCSIRSNNFDGIYSCGTHNLLVQNCFIGGEGTYHNTGTGIGFHAPPDDGYGDSAVLINNIIYFCTNAIYNEELNCTVIGGNFELCGVYGNFVGVVKNTWIGVYTLDITDGWAGYGATNGFAGQIRMDPFAAPQTIFQNCGFTWGRPAFDETNNAVGLTGYVPPVVIGPDYYYRQYYPGLYNGTNNVTAWALTANTNYWSPQVMMPDAAAGQGFTYLAASTNFIYRCFAFYTGAWPPFLRVPYGSGLGFTHLLNSVTLYNPSTVPLSCDALISADSYSGGILANEASTTLRFTNIAPNRFQTQAGVASWNKDTSPRVLEIKLCRGGNTAVPPTNSVYLTHWVTQPVP